MEYKLFSEIDLDDVFFDSLKQDYQEFVSWYDRKSKSGSSAWVQYNSDNHLEAFLYTKDESTEDCSGIFPDRPIANRLKVGTFKINAHGTTLGQRFIKKILDEAVEKRLDEIYVTIFPKHTNLISLVTKYGFALSGQSQRGENVYVKNLTVLTGDMLHDYPLISTQNKNKYLLSVYPKYHTKLFPDSILKNEEDYRYDLIQDVSPTNSIHKTYICFMKDVVKLKKGNIVCIYRTNDELGPARYRSVVTSVCQVEEVRTKASFANMDGFISYTERNSVFSEDELSEWYSRKDVFVIKMTYNIALTKRVTRNYMLESIGMSPSDYWGFMRLTDEQFDAIIKKGEIHENLIVNKA